jgi:hypothetical protein
VCSLHRESSAVLFSVSSILILGIIAYFYIIPNSSFPHSILYNLTTSNMNINQTEKQVSNDKHTFYLQCRYNIRIL